MTASRLYYNLRAFIMQGLMEFLVILSYIVHTELSVRQVNREGHTESFKLLVLPINLLIQS